MIGKTAQRISSKVNCKPFRLFPDVETFTQQSLQKYSLWCKGKQRKNAKKFKSYILSKISEIVDE